MEGEPDFFSLSLAKNVFLTKHVEGKVLANGDKFTGKIDAVTGDLIHGILLLKDLNELYEGPFVNGMRHGDSAICKKLDLSSRKFVGSYREDHFEHGTFMAKEFTYSGDFGGGDFGNPIFHGKGLLAQVDKTVYEGEFQESQYEGHGVLTTAKRDRYDGKFSNGRKTGLGTMQYRDGSSYSGNWKFDLRHGRGVYATANDARIFSGEFQFGQPHGSGTLAVKDVEMKGSWNQGRPVDGSGWKILYLKKGLVYKGQTKCGRPHGRGSVLRLASESLPKTAVLHSIPFCCGLPTPRASDCEYHVDSIGEPSLSPMKTTVEEAISQFMDLSTSEQAPRRRLENDPVVDGEAAANSCRWVDGVEAALATAEPMECPVTRIRISRSEENESHVTVTLMDDSEYVGQISNGVMEGPATFTDALNDSVFTGTFQAGLKHGEGSEQYGDGTVYKGNYTHGWRDGRGKLLNQDGDVIYKGEWTGDKKHGKGVCKYESASPYPGSYQGDLKHDQRHGRGTLTTGDGTTYEGDWCNGIPQFGDWVVTYPSGSVYLGSAAFADDVSPPVAMGFGSQRESDGSFYTGNFLHGQRHGAGVCLFSSGETLDGNWENDTFVKDGTSP